jgi:hypothetical protein
MEPPKVLKPLFFNPIVKGWSDPDARCKPPMIIRTALASDINGILNLQAQNLLANLSDTERSQGFVTTPFTQAQIQVLLAQGGVFVAVEEETILGYVFAGSWDYFSQWPIFPYMVSRFPQIQFQGVAIDTEKTFQYGPVCIDRTLRGTGILPKLFEIMRTSFSFRFPIGVTFINQHNLRSLAAHTRKLNLEIIDTFEFNGNSFYGLAFSTQRIN